MNLADHTRIRIAKSFGAVAAVLSLTGTVMLLVLGRADYLIGTGALNFGVLGVGLGILTWLMIPAQPRNGAVWALAWASLFAAMFTFGVASTAFLVRGPFPALTYDALLEMSPAMLPRSAAIALHFRFWALVPALWLPLTLGLLLFPDGSPPSPRWRWVGWWSVGAITVSSVATAVNLNPWSTLAIRTADTTAQGLLGVVNDSAFLLASISALVSVASLVVRYRRSAGVTRSQIRWIAFGGAVFAASLIVGPMVESTSGAIEALGGVFFESLLIGAFGIAIARYRLYDIDIVISRTVTYAVLAAFITGMYALIVVGVGSLLGGGDEPNLALSIAAVALVAVAFEPLRNRVQHAANRLVFGDRASPYEVLAKATSRLADTGSPEGTLAQVTQLVTAGTGAVATVLWLKVGRHLQPHSATPAEALMGLTPLVIADRQLPDVPGEAVVPVRHRDELLGAITITKPRGQSVTAADEKVLADVAAGSGLLLRNIGLNAELAERAAQLQVSRRRLVAAHDAERHRLERDLHDGAQQQVVALKVKLGIARALAEREGVGKVADIVSDLAATTQQAVDAMRAVAHGIYPPLLEAEGLEVALTAARRTFPVPVDTRFEGVGRYSRSIEESVYFCTVEIITRAIDGGAESVGLVLKCTAGGVDFMVRHDGEAGDLLAVEDRMSALGGDLSVMREGSDSVIGGRLPQTDPAMEPV